jgi:hypothetical protein
MENMEKVRVIRLRKSVGLMMARQAGINSIGAEYFVCLDCHMEVLPGKYSFIYTCIFYSKLVRHDYPPPIVQFG